MKQKLIVSMWPDLVALRELNQLLSNSKQLQVQMYLEKNQRNKVFMSAELYGENAVKEARKIIANILYSEGITESVLNENESLILPSGSKVNPAYIPEILKRAEAAWREQLADDRDRYAVEVVIPEINFRKFEKRPLQPQSNSEMFASDNIQTWTITEDVAEKIRECAKFVDPDHHDYSLRYVHVFENRIIGTDALLFRVYVGSTGLPDINIPIEIAKKVKSGLLQITKTTWLLNGKEFEPSIVKSPDFDSVMQRVHESEKRCTFVIDCAEFQTEIKSALPFANRTSSFLLLSLNGHNKLIAEDVDFETETAIEMRVNTRTGEACRCYSGKLLLKALRGMKGPVKFEILPLNDTLRSAGITVINRTASEMTLIAEVEFNSTSYAYKNYDAA